MREPVTSEELEAQEAVLAKAPQEPGPQSSAPGSPTPGELEERAQEAENRAEAAERRVFSLEEEMRILRDQMAMLLRATRTPQLQPDAAGKTAPENGLAVPVFDEEMPHGLVVGDTEVAYVQDGHQFGRDKKYLRTEAKNMGCGRPFNPRLIGWVKPRPNQSPDALDGFRDRAPT